MKNYYNLLLEQMNNPASASFTLIIVFGIFFFIGIYFVRFFF